MGLNGTEPMTSLCPIGFRIDINVTPRQSSTITNTSGVIRVASQSAGILTSRSHLWLALNSTGAPVTVSVWLQWD